MAKAAVSDREVSAGVQSARPFECSWEDCPKSFNRKSDLQRHYRIHTNERPYYCTHAGCSKTFIQRSALTVHNRTHTGEKPHRCKHEGCGKKFSDSSSLARHRRIHSGERNYICEVPECRKEFCRKTTLTKHAKKHPVEHSGVIDDDGDDTADDDWDSDPEDSAHDLSYSTPQALSRPTSCFGNHWPLPAETVQQTQFGKPPNRLDTSLENVKLERSATGSPSNQSVPDVSSSIDTYSYMPTSNISHKPPPVRTQTLPDYRSVPMSHQFSNDSPLDTFQSPTSFGSPDAFTQFPSQPGSIHSQSFYLQQTRYGTYPQAPRVHDIQLEDPMQITQQQANLPASPMDQYADNAEPMSAQQSRFNMNVTAAEQLQGYIGPVSVAPCSRYQEPQASMVDDYPYHGLPLSTYGGSFGAPEWYTNIKPEETWPGYDLPSDRVQGF